MKYISIITSCILMMSFTAFTQNHINYQAQYIHYSEFTLSGLRQSIELSHYIQKKIKIYGGVHLASGRGKDISSDFKKDYVLFSKYNWENVPDFFW